MLDSNTIKILIKDAQKALKERHIYDALYCTMMLVYLLINKLLMRKISKITPAQVLKNRE